MSVLNFTTCYTKQRKSKEKIKAKNGKTVNLDIMDLCTNGTENSGQWRTTMDKVIEKH